MGCCDAGGHEGDKPDRRRIRLLLVAGALVAILVLGILAQRFGPAGGGHSHDDGKESGDHSH